MTLDQRDQGNIQVGATMSMATNRHERDLSRYAFIDQFCGDDLLAAEDNRILDGLRNDGVHTLLKVIIPIVRQTQREIYDSFLIEV